MNMDINIGTLRSAYRDRSEVFLIENLVAREPIGQFHAWFEEAKSNQKILEPNAMCLSTATKNGIPSGRFVLCKGYGKRGFKFFTNLESRKATELKENPNAALTVHWGILCRSVRIEGTITMVSEEEGEKYFHSRPVDSQVGASSSHQSKPIQSRDVLYDNCKDFENHYVQEGLEVPKPRFWGGYLLTPSAVEFWQGQKDRLSDRIKFRRESSNEVPDGILLHQGEDGWVFERLSP